MKRIVAFALAALAIAVPASAAFAGPAFICAMTNTLKPDDRLEMTFVVTDEKAGEGMAFGNAGTADLRVARGYHGLNFFEVTLVGNVMLATIVLPDQLPVAAVAPQAKYPNVYSRHTVMDAFVDGGTETRGELVPSQYLGECTLKN